MAFGVNIFLVGIALVFAVGLPPALFPKAPPLVFYSVSIFLIANRYLIIFPWQLVGVGRACNRSIADEKKARLVGNHGMCWAVRVSLTLPLCEAPKGRQKVDIFRYAPRKLALVAGFRVGQSLPNP